MDDLLRGAFIYGVGIESEQFIVEIANNILMTTYKIWIDGSFECELKSNFINKELMEDEVALLTLNQLTYLNIESAQLKQNDDLWLSFENGMHLTIFGSNPDTNCVESWRFYQLTPVMRPILIVSNK